MTTKEKLRTAIKLRLEMLIPYMSRWPEAMALGSSPTSLPHTLQYLAQLFDDIWHIAGDRSTDVSYTISYHSYHIIPHWLVD
jgi:ubiquinone biosynthesis protein COQ9